MYTCMFAHLCTVFIQRALAITPLSYVLVVFVQVMSDLDNDALRDAFRRLLPLPARTRYTAVTCMPQPPSLIGRAFFKANSDPTIRCVFSSRRSVTGQVPQTWRRSNIAQLPIIVHRYWALATAVVVVAAVSGLVVWRRRRS